jgi:hypothetical protein
MVCFHSTYKSGSFTFANFEYWQRFEFRGQFDQPLGSQEGVQMNPLHYVAAVFGIAFGVVLTLQINRLLRGPVTGEPPDHTNDLTHFGSYSNTSDGSNSYTAWIGKRFPGTTGSASLSVSELQKEKASLQARLQAIDSQLQQITQTASQQQSAARDQNVVKSTDKTQNSKGSVMTAVVLKPACEYDFKVYVYEIPPALDSIRISQEARRNRSLHVCHKCILEQFSLEYIVNDYFTQFCGRTYNPDEADFFYLPLVRDAEFRMAMSISTRNRAPSASEWALLNLLEKNDSTLWRDVFNITDRYWHAHNGADHIIAMPAPVTNIRHETSQRGFFHYMMHLHPPIFLCLEYSIGFVQEYPLCATGKNIVVPYPTTDPELFSGKLTSAKVERKYLLYYAGGLHGDCVEVRKAMKVLMQNSTKLANVIPPVRSNQAEREHGFLAATFCPIPIGDSPSSKRMYDVLNFGCIPVVLSDDLVWAFSDQTGGPLNHSAFSLQIPQSVVHYTARKTLNRYALRWCFHRFVEYRCRLSYLRT